VTHSVCTVAVGLLALLAGAPLFAAEWRALPAVTAGTGSDSNIRLAADESRRAASASVAASIDIAARRPGFLFELRPEVRALRYADDVEADRDDGFLTFGVNVNDPHKTFRVGGNYARESTLTSEFYESGLLGVDVERVQRGVDAGFTRVLSPRSTLGVGLAAMEVGYGAAPGSQLGDYGYRSAQLTHRRNTGEHSTWALTASKSLLEPESGGRDTISTSLRADWSRQFSPRLRGSIGFGAFVIDEAEGGVDDQSASVSFALARQWDRWSLSTAGERDVRPDGSGTLVVEEAVTLEGRRRVTEHVELGVSVRGARVSASIADLFDFERRYSQVGANVHWQATRRLNVDASVYERSNDSSFTRRATGLTTVLSITYRGA
jgi:hypothetical protein